MRSQYVWIDAKFQFGLILICDLISFRFVIHIFGLVPEPQNNSITFRLMPKYDSGLFRWPNIIQSRSVRSQSFNLGIAPRTISINIFPLNHLIIYRIVKIPIIAQAHYSTLLPSTLPVTQISEKVFILWRRIKMNALLFTTAKTQAVALEIENSR